LNRINSALFKVLSGDQDSDILFGSLKSRVLMYPGMKVHKCADRSYYEDYKIRVI
jgi:hypothetical protein